MIMKKIFLLIQIIVYSNLLNGQSYQSYKATFQPPSTFDPSIIYGGDKSDNLSNKNYNYESESPDTYQNNKKYYDSNEIILENRTSNIRVVTIYIKSGLDWKELQSYRVFQDEKLIIRKSKSEFYSDYGFEVDNGNLGIRNCSQINSIY